MLFHVQAGTMIWRMWSLIGLLPYWRDWLSNPMWERLSEELSKITWLTMLQSSSISNRTSVTIPNGEQVTPVHLVGNKLKAGEMAEWPRMAKPKLTVGWKHPGVVTKDTKVLITKQSIKLWSMKRWDTKTKLLNSFQWMIQMWSRCLRKCTNLTTTCPRSYTLNNRNS